MDRTIINIHDCNPFHTKFAEDLFESNINLNLQFTEVEDYYISERISLEEIYNYTKRTYNYEMDYYDEYKDDNGNR